MRIDVDYFTHPKTISQSPMGQLLWLRALAYCKRHLTDGRITHQALSAIAADLSIGQADPVDSINTWIDGLIHCGLIDKDGDQLSIHDFLEWNKSKEDIDYISKTRRMNGKLGGRPKANEKQTESKPKANEKQNLTHSVIVSEYQSTEIKEKEESKPLRATDDKEWIEGLRKSPAYSHVNMDMELGKMDAWLSLPKNKNRKKTRSFILNWLNKIEPPVSTAKHPGMCQERVQRGTCLKPCGEPAVTVMSGRALCKVHKEKHDNPHTSSAR